jgi:hypothetical protein
LKDKKDKQPARVSEIKKNQEKLRQTKNENLYSYLDDEHLDEAFERANIKFLKSGTGDEQLPRYGKVMTDMPLSIGGQMSSKIE